MLSFRHRSAEGLFLRHYGLSLSEVRFVDTQRTRWLNGVERLWLMATLRSPYRQLFRPQIQAALDDMISRAALRPHPLLRSDVRLLPIPRLHTGDKRHPRGEVRLAQEDRAVTRRMILSRAFQLLVLSTGRGRRTEAVEAIRRSDSHNGSRSSRMVAVEPSLRRRRSEWRRRRFFARDRMPSRAANDGVHGPVYPPPKRSGHRVLLDQIFP